MSNEITQSTPVTYESIRKRIQRKHIDIRFMELRNHFTTFMVRHGLIREEADLLQGRIPANVFIRHYWTPSFDELKDRTLVGFKGTGDFFPVIIHWLPKVFGFRINPLLRAF